MPHMNVVLMTTALLLLLCLVAGLLRTLLGPTLSDRMVAVQLLGTGGVALLLLLSTLLALPALTDVALVLALLAVVAVASMTRREVQDG